MKVSLPDNAFRDQPIPRDISQAGDIGAYINRTSAPISVDLNPTGTSIVFTLFDEDLDKPFPGVWS